MSDAAPPPSDADDEDEFANIPEPRRQRHPMVALTIVGLALLVGWHLRADIAYAFRARAPRALGDARTLLGRGVELRDNEYVTLSGNAERSYALYVEPKGQTVRQTVFRLLGGGDGLFVLAADTSPTAEHPPPLDEHWTGRLRRFDALPFAESLRSYYAGHAQATRFLALDALHKVLRHESAELRDRQAAPLTLDRQQPVVVDVDYPGELKVYLSEEKYPSLDDAHHELVRAGLAPSAGQKLADEYVFVLPLPAAPEAKRAALLDLLAEREIAFSPREERYTVKLDELALAGDELAIGGAAAVKVPWERVKGVGVPLPLTVPPGAFILLEGTAPATFWWAPLLALLLVVFAGFNLWYLGASLRGAHDRPHLRHPPA